MKKRNLLGWASMVVCSSCMSIQMRTPKSKWSQLRSTDRANCSSLATPTWAASFRDLRPAGANFSDGVYAEVSSRTGRRFFKKSDVSGISSPKKEWIALPEGAEYLGFTADFLFFSFHRLDPENEAQTLTSLIYWNPRSNKWAKSKDTFYDVTTFAWVGAKDQRIWIFADGEQQAELIRFDIEEGNILTHSRTTTNQQMLGHLVDHNSSLSQILVKKESFGQVTNTVQHNSEEPEINSPEEDEFAFTTEDPLNDEFSQSSDSLDSYDPFESEDTGLGMETSIEDSVEVGVDSGDAHMETDFNEYEGLALRETPSSNTAINSVTEPEEEEFQTSLELISFDQQGRLAGSQSLATESGGVESYTFSWHGKQLSLAYIKGNSLVGEASVHLLEAYRGPEGVWITRNNQIFSFDTFHLGSPHWVRSPRGDELVFLQWLDGESTLARIATKEQGGVNQPNYYGVFPAGTRIMGIFSEDAKMLIRQKEKLDWKFSVCSL